MGVCINDLNIVSKVIWISFLTPLLAPASFKFNIALFIKLFSWRCPVWFNKIIVELFHRFY